MTLIAIAPRTDGADIVTDTGAYLGGGSEFSHSSKVLPLSHLEATVLTQGSTYFGDLARTQLTLASRGVPDLDALTDFAPELLRDVWQMTHQHTAPGEPAESAAFLVGYSAAREGFAAFVLSSEDDFEASEIRGLFVHPSPLSVRPSDLELTRLVAHAHPADVATLRGRKEPDAPTTTDGWVRLAQACREERAMITPASGLKVFVMGRVFHTTMSRGRVATDLVHTFDDSGEEFQAMVAGTMHPQGQLGPCPCGSGDRYLDCCLPGQLDEDCLCGSSKSLRDCCWVYAGQAVEVTEPEPA